MKKTLSSTVNLVTDEIKPVCPWEFVPATPIPAHVRGDKAARTAWITDPTTRHNCYSMWEGTIANLRVTQANPKDDGANPPFSLVGICADYDMKWDPKKGIPGGLRYPPNYVCQSLSGNLHAVWLLEKQFPVGVGQRVTKAFLSELADALELRQVWYSWDKEAFLKPSQLLTNGLSWTKLDEEIRVSTEFLQGILRRVLEKETRISTQRVAKFEGEAKKKIVQALKAKYPRFSEWPGEFEAGAQGPTFWIPESTSPMSAIVKEDGIYTFSAHAGKPWWSWAQLVGAAVTKEVDTERIGRAVEGIWFDGLRYWSENPSSNSWRHSIKDVLRRNLIVNRGLSPKVPKGSDFSEVDAALAFVESSNSIEQATVYPFRDPGVFFDPVVDGRALNISNRRPVTPSDECQQVWGPEGKFPWLSHFFDGFLITPESLVSLLAWMRHAYATAWDKDPQSGQSIFLVGGAGLGKTFFSQQIFGSLMGGFRPAEKYLLGVSQFNSEMFEEGVWTVDDGSIAHDKKAREAFADKVKAIAANPVQDCEAKYLKTTKVRWQGRLVVTLNADPKSLRMLPVVDGTLLDKICLYRLNDNAKPGFGVNRENETRIAKELPFFARWLLEWEVPEHLLGDPRFGVKAFLDEDLLRAARAGSSETAIREILIEWLDSHLANSPEKKEWTGTTRILRANLAGAALDEFKYCSAADLDGYLVKFSTQEFPYTMSYKDSNRGSRVWTFRKPTK